MMDNWQSLSSLLQQSQNRLSQWASEFEDILSSTINREEKCALERKVADLERAFEDKVKNKEKASEDQKILIADLKEEVEVIATKKAASEKRITLYEDELAHLRKEEQDLREAPVVDALQKTKRLEEEDAQFRKQLALDVIKIKGGYLQFVFTQIDDRNPELPYTLSLGLDENRKYKVPSSDPVIADLEELVDQLNCSNNLDKFLHTVRRRFQSTTSHK
ncbi:kinetochore protein Spc25 [Aplysia californica]|uniref:Kinetochore protein SPC25 n=1 Tax=Aplysia californica TaxID=6500 RepID=A0ABM1A7Y6_APLCA|nr:kinetochore protein Spc25 [Aplysia californica]